MVAVEVGITVGRVSAGEAVGDRGTEIGAESVGDRVAVGEMFNGEVIDGEMIDGSVSGFVAGCGVAVAKGDWPCALLKLIEVSGNTIATTINQLSH